MGVDEAAGVVYRRRRAAIVSTIGSFPVWEAANVWIQEFPAIRAKERAVSF